MPCTEFSGTGKPPCPVKSPTWCSLETSASRSRSWLRRGIQGGQGLFLNVERCHKSRKGRNPYGGFVKLGAPKSSKIRQFYHWIPSFGSLFWTIDIVRYEHHDKTLACWGHRTHLWVCTKAQKERRRPEQNVWALQICGRECVGGVLGLTLWRHSLQRGPPQWLVSKPNWRYNATYIHHKNIHKSI